MYMTFLLGEARKMMRDPMLRFMIGYPIVFGIIGRYVIPWAAEIGALDLRTQGDFPLVFLLLMTPHVFGAVIGFSILDDRDDGVLISIGVTPLGVHRFLSFRLILLFTMSVVSCLYVLWFSNLGILGAGDILGLSLLASLAAPMSGLLINAVATNKIEGFAVMKGTGIILIFPIAGMFFADAKELLFGFAPGFWPAKVVSTVVRGSDAMFLGYWQYYGIGLAYVVLLNVLAYRSALRRMGN